MKYTKQILIVALCAIVLLTPLSVFAQQGFQLVPCGGSNPDGTENDPCTFTDLIVLIYRIINLLLAASGAVAVLMMFYYAFQMVSSLGEPEKLAGAKQGITRAIIGFSIVLLSFVIIGIFLSAFGIECKPWEVGDWLTATNCTQ